MDDERENGRAGATSKNGCKRTLSAYTRVPFIRALPPRALIIIGVLIGINIAVWIAVGIVSHFYPGLAGTAILAWTLGLRHALDADHISAIDLMTRRLVAANQRPVAVGTFFSLGHSTIVIVTSIVVAATAATVSDKFDGFSQVGGIIGSAVSAAFLLVLGMANAYILLILLRQLRETIAEYRVALGSNPQHLAMDFKLEGGGVFFRIFKKLFKLVDRPWKMYPLGVLFGLGFDTSSQVALLGISAVQSAEGRSFWLILIFPVLFTAGMCLIDTTDGALMLSLYTVAARLKGEAPSISARESDQNQRTLTDNEVERERRNETTELNQEEPRRPDPLTLLYYNVILTVLTVIVAIVIGVVQVLGLVDSVSSPSGKFWDGVREVEDKFDIVGGAVCGAFAFTGIASVLLHKRWRRWVLEGRVEEFNAERV